MKKLLIFLMLMLATPFVFADWFYNSKNVLVNIDISSDAEVVSTGVGGYIDSATINMTFFPKQTDEQELSNFYTNPAAELKDNALRFIWMRPSGKFDFRIRTNVKTASTIKEIREKINFPLQKLPDDALIYTKPSETIDSGNEDIIRVASELVKGEDDLYSAVFKLADWTKNNINYNLSTLTAEISQKASWVLQNKQGVCDELTSLFIALSRAVGIPARFVSGIAYTNSPLFPDNWGAHGWAEVYFPDYGWVPFDVTYGEFGWVDPTHIKFKDSIDSDEPSTYYNWLGRNADLKTGKLNIKTELIDKAGYNKIPLIIEANALKQSVDFGSYNLVEASVENPNNFYYATELHLNKPKEVKIVGDAFKSILLLPKEKKKVFWILKVEDNLDGRYIYTFPLIASTLNNISSETGFISNNRERHVSSDEIGQIAQILEENKVKKYSGNVDLNCKSDKNEFYTYESVGLDCHIKNTGNVFLENVNVCFEGNCTKFDLGISQSKSVKFDINKSTIGYRESTVTLRNNLVSKVHYTNINVKDAPKIEIEDLEFPVNVSYGENFTVFFTLSKKSQSNPENVEVIFSQNGIEKKWNIKEMAENRKFVLDLLGSDLKFGANNYKIKATYYDELQKMYIFNREFAVNLTKATFIQRFLLWLKTLKI